MTTLPIRAHSDFNKSFKLYTDASDTGLEAVLTQMMKREKREL